MADNLEGLGKGAYSFEGQGSRGIVKVKSRVFLTNSKGFPLELNELRRVTLDQISARGKSFIGINDD